MSKKSEDDLAALQLALVQYQQQAIASGRRDVIVFEGRDAAGKDGAIKRIKFAYECCPSLSSSP